MAGFKSFLKKTTTITTKKKSQKSSASIRSANDSSHGGSNRHQSLDELTLVFNKFDANGDGKISASELRSIMSSLGQSVSDEEVRSMIREVDSDGDGFIDLSEFVELNTKGVDSDEILVNLRDAFAVYDIDGDGSISADELMEIMRSLGDSCSIADCRRMISGADVDGDGSISFEEFRVMMMTGVRFNAVI